jgi:F0F1-type ATP synthase assembly protein I
MVDDDGVQPLGGRDLIGLGGLLVGAVVGWTALGLILDHWTGSSPVGVVAGVGLGIVSGAAGFAIRVRRALRPVHEEDQRTTSK